jgi:23S rRNA (cytidine1920-2'-O)/16S rRNA (cytidine1409-2'-O)-methyltransferase
MKESYVGRGALKLLGALSSFEISVKGLTCVDLGASTGGFTEVLLEQGARHVFAVDTAYGELAWKLRQDERVTVLERTNARRIESFPEKIDLVVIDISLIRLEVILESIEHWIEPGTPVIALLKVQYQIRDKKKLKKGVVQDPQTREIALKEFFDWQFAHQSWSLKSAVPSAIRGGSGNQEYFVLMGFMDQDQVPACWEDIRKTCLQS